MWLGRFLVGIIRAIPMPFLTLLIRAIVRKFYTIKRSTAEKNEGRASRLYLSVTACVFLERIYSGNTLVQHFLYNTIDDVSLKLYFPYC
jgi:hypothetical protein